MSSTMSSDSTVSHSSGRRKQRSRSGCQTCRSRGYKCDEKKPICRACSRLGRTCHYGQATKWVNETVINKGRVVIKQVSQPATSDTTNHPIRTGEWQVQKWNQSRTESGGYASRSGTPESISSSLSPHSLHPLDLRLLSHWSNFLAPALDFSSTNSFCYFITPMALSPQCPPALYHALMALSAAHLATHDTAMEFVALKEQQRSIKLLKGIVESNEIGEEALATVLMLRIFEDFTASPNSTAAMYHGSGASSIIRSGKIQSSTSPTAAFLLSIFSYYDVISSISLEQSTYLSPHERLPTQDSDVDLFMHYTSPILHQLSQISSVVDCLKQTTSSDVSLSPHSDNSDYPSPTALYRVQQIMQNLEVPIDITKSPSSHNDYIFTAEAYRYAALVYLTKVILTWSIPLSSIPARISATSCLSSLANVPIDAPVTGRHLYPLFTAACECSEADREFSRDRLEILANRGGGLPNVKRVWGLVQKVWAQKDALKDGARMKLGCFEVMKRTGQVILIS